MVELSTEFDSSTLFFNPLGGNGERKSSTGNGKMKNGNKTELEMKSLIGLRWKLGFFLIFHFHAARAYPPFPVLYFINIPAPCSERILFMETWQYQISHVILRCVYLNLSKDLPYSNVKKSHKWPN